MFRTIMTALAVSLSMGTSVSAATQTFNFVEMADTFWGVSGVLNPLESGQNFEATWDQGVVAHETLTLGATDGWWDGSILGLGGSGGLLEVMANSVGGTSTSPTPLGSDHAFLDYNGGEGPAGLGVCSTGIYSESGFDISRCSTNFIGAGGFGTFDTTDSNSVAPEILELKFSSLVSLSLGAVTNALHSPATGIIQVAIDGGAFVDFSVTGGFFDDTSDLAGTTFWFRSAQGEAYLAAVTASTDVSPVPLPAGFVLLLSSFGLLGAARLRRKS